MTGILAAGNAGADRFLEFLGEVRQFMDIKHFSEEIHKSVFVFFGLKFPTQVLVKNPWLLCR